MSDIKELKRVCHLLDLNYDNIAEGVDVFGDPRRTLILDDNLLWLDLSYESIRRLPDGIFKKFNALKRLFIDNNELEHISIGVVDTLPTLEVLNLRGNRNLPAYLQKRFSQREEMLKVFERYEKERNKD